MVVLVIAAFLLVALRYPLDPDVGWFLAATRRMMAGERLYTDIIEVNPPLIFYLMAPVTLLADFFHLADETALNLATIGLVVLSMGLSAHLFLAGRSAPAGSALFLLVTAGALLIVPAVDFGQREHLMVVLVLPFIVVKWRRASELGVPGWEGWLCGAAAGLGFALKPFFVPIWLALEVVSAVQVRGSGSSYRVRRETLGVVLVLLAYSVFSVLVHPEYFSMMLRLTHLYNSYGSDGSFGPVGMFYALTLAPLIIGFLALRTRMQLGPLVSLLLVFAGMGLLMGIVQGKGWRYHFLPCFVAMSLAIGVMAWELLVQRVRPEPTPPLRMILSGLGVAVATLLLVSRLNDAFAFQDRQRAAWTTRVGTLAPHEPRSLLVMGEFVADAFPLSNYLRVYYASPYSGLWWVRAIREAGDGSDRTNAVEDELFGRLVGQFVEVVPDLVLVDTAAHPWAGGEAFPFVEYFSRDSAFAAAWSGYTRVGSLERFVVMSSQR